MSLILATRQKHKGTQSKSAVFWVTLFAIIPTVKPDHRAIALLIGSSSANYFDAVFELWTWFSLALILFIFLFTQWKGRYIDSCIICPLLLFLGLTASTFLSGYKEIDLLLLTFWRIVCPFLLCAICTRATFSSFCKAWYFFLTITMIFNSISMYLYAEHDGMYLSMDITGYGRGYYLYGLDNVCFMYALAGAAVGSFYYRVKFGHIPLRFFLIYCFIFGAFFYTAAGTAMVIASLLLLFLICFDLFNKPNINPTISILICAAGFVLIVLVQNVDVFSPILKLIGKDSTFTGRTQIWDAAFRALSGDELFGFGISPINMHRVLSYVVNNSFIALQIGHLHNIILEFYFKGGVIGLVFFLLTLLLPFKKAHQHPCSVIVSMLSMYFILMWFTCMFEFRLDTITFWLIPILMGHLNLIDKNGRFFLEEVAE